MTDFGTEFRSSEDLPTLFERAAAARAAARTAAARYVRLRRQAEATRNEAIELCAKAVQLRDDLRHLVTAYAAILRRADVPPERAVIMVKSVVGESDGYPDTHHREAMEEAVRWAVDAYYAA